MPLWNPIDWSAGAVARPGPRLRRLGARHDPAEVRAALRRRVHPDARASPSSTTTSGSSAASSGRSTARGGAAARGDARADRSSSTRGGRSTSGTRATSSSRPSRTAGTTSTAASPRSCPTPSGSIPPPTPSTGPTAASRAADWIDARTSRSSATGPPSPAPGSSTRRGSRPIAGLTGPTATGRCRRSSSPTTLLARPGPASSTTPRSLAWVEPTTASRAGRLPARQRPGAGETVTVAGDGPQRVELDAVLERPGPGRPGRHLLPGWTLTIDGQPAPIYREPGCAARRCAAGRHRLVYAYRPCSFAAGALDLGGGAGRLRAALGGLVPAAIPRIFRRPVDLHHADPLPW